MGPSATGGWAAARLLPSPAVAAMSSPEPSPSPAPAPARGLGLPLVVSLTLGLAPFSPEPHLLGKLRWVAGGAVGMGPMDWFDLAMHGAPWVWLTLAALGRLRARAGRPSR